MFLKTFPEEYEFELRITNPDSVSMFQEAIGFASVDLSKFEKDKRLTTDHLHFYNGRYFAGIILTYLDAEKCIIWSIDNCASTLNFDIQETINWCENNDLYLLDKDGYDLWLPPVGIKLK